MSDIFRFKQFNVNQQGCAMKINTDGVLLGALIQGKQPEKILDIGTGTGVIALMMAQRFSNAHITGVEVDATAAQMSAINFEESHYSNRLKSYLGSFQAYYSEMPDAQFDLIVSNPPFYIHSLQSPAANKALAKHADVDFFSDLITQSAKHLHANGSLWLVLPMVTAALVKQLAASYALFVQQIISIQSYPDSDPHREIIAFGLRQTEIAVQRFVIYGKPKEYSEAYERTLKDFFTIF